MHKKPWLQCPDIWKTEASFWGWVRGVLRKGWSRHPVKLEFIKLNRKRIKNPNPKNIKRLPEVWGMTCDICKKDTEQSNIEIDHVGASSKFTCLEDMKSYAEHLFLVSFSSLRALCKPCHKIVNHSQRSGVSFEEAALQKKVIAFIKEHSVKEIVAFLQSQEYNNCSNAAKRKAALLEIFTKQAKENTK